MNPPLPLVRRRAKTLHLRRDKNVLSIRPEKEQNRRFLSALPRAPISPANISCAASKKLPRPAARRKWMPSFDLYATFRHIFYVWQWDIIRSTWRRRGFSLRRGREGGEGGKSIHVYRQNVSLLIHASTNKDCGSKTLYCSSFSSPYVIQIRMYHLNINTCRQHRNLQ